MFLKLKQFINNYLKRNKFRGFTIGVVFKYEATDKIKADQNFGEEDVNINFTDYLTESILKQGGLVALIDNEKIEELLSGSYKNVIQTTPQAKIILFGKLKATTLHNANVRSYQITYQCITRNGTVIGGGNFYTSWFLSSLSPAADQVLNGVRIKNLGPIDPINGYREVMYENGYRISAIESSEEKLLP